ncbi:MULTISPECIES: hypothetical protein [unclassified Sphingobacterium]|nr:MULTISPECIES: hypothetical protein [unclassified Sphingobacterium]
MKNLNEKVWYACYPSILLQEKFLFYIQGGSPPVQTHRTLDVRIRRL